MAEDSGGLGGLLGWFGRGYDPQAAYEGLLSSQATKDALHARSLASIAQAFGAGAGSDARGSAIPFGTTMGNAAAAAYSGQDALIAARNVAAEQQLHQAQAGVQRGILSLQPIELEMYRRFAAQQEKEAGGGQKTAGLSPQDIIKQGGGGSAEQTYWTPQGLAALRPTEGAYDQIHYPSGSPSTASGAYGFLDSTWQQQAPKAGVDIEKYPRAYLAPPEVQDKVAAITPISHWTGTDAKGNPYNFRAQRLATNPAFVTGGAAPAEPRQAGGGGREPTAAETAIYAQTPGTVQNAARRAPTDSAFWNTAQPTGTLGAAPSGAPLGPAVAPPTPPGGTPATSPAAARGLLDLPIVPDYTGKLGGAAPPATPQGQGAALVPGGSPPSLLTQQDPVTARTIDAIAAAGPRRGAPGINAADAGAGMGSIVAPGAMAGAAPPVDPRLATLAQRVAGPGAPSGEPPAPAAPSAAGGLLGGGALQRTIDQAGGGLLNAPPPAPPPAAPPVAPPAAVPPAAAPAAATGAPAMPPGGIPLPALPPMPTLPAPPQMRDVPVPPMPAPTTLEGMAQAIAGISSLTGHPAPAFMQDLAKMPAARQQELYKAYLLNETNAMNEKYKAQIQLTTSEYVKAAEEKGVAPYRIQQELLKQQLWLNPQTNRYEMLPGAVEKLAIEKKTEQDAIAAREKEVATHQSGLRTGEKGQELLLTQLIDKRHPEALDAVRSLQSSAEARQLLDQKVITGFGAPAKLQFGKALQALGFHYNDDPIANTEAFISARGGETARALKPFGTGGGVSDADRIYARQMVGGDIAFNEQSLRKLLEISDKAHHTTIDNFNHDLERQAPKLVPALKVEKPEAPASAHPAGGYEFDRATGTMKPRTNPQ